MPSLSKCLLYSAKALGCVAILVGTFEVISYLVALATDSPTSKPVYIVLVPKEGD